MVMVITIALLISGCTQNQPKPEPQPEQQEPIEEQEPSKDKEENIVEIEPVDKVSTENLTLLCRFDADLDQDGTEEGIEMYTSAQKDSKGEVMWDDGQKWLLLVREEDKDFVLYDNYIQLGELKFWLYTEENGQYHISTLQPASSGMYFSDYTFNKEKNVVVKKAVYEASDINLIYSSQY